MSYVVYVQSIQQTQQTQIQQAAELARTSVASAQQYLAAAAQQCLTFAGVGSPLHNRILTEQNTLSQLHTTTIQNMAGALSLNRIQQIETYAQWVQAFAQQVQLAATASATCGQLLANPAPALLQYLGWNRVTQLSHESHQLITEIANGTEINPSSLQHVVNIAAEIEHANLALADQGDPVGALNQQIDRELFGHQDYRSVVNRTSADTLHPAGFISPQRLAEMWYVSAQPQQQWRAEALQSQAQQDRAVAMGPPPPPLETVSEIKAQGPAPANHDLPLDVTLSIERMDNGSGHYRAEIQAGEQPPETLSIPVNYEEVAKYSQGLRDFLEEEFIAEHFGSPTQVYQEQDRRNDWEALATKGAEIFQRIFDEPARQQLEKYLRHGTDEPKHRKSSLRIEAEDFFLPWELLAWPASAEAEPLEQRLWGFLYSITRTVIDAEQTITRPHLIADQFPDLLFFANSREDPQAILLDQLNAEQHVALNKVDPLVETDEQSRENEIAILPELCNRRWHVVHFGCHAFGSGQELDAGFVVQDHFELRLGDFLRTGCQLEGAPLVFLNACQTGIMQTGSPLDSRAAADFVRVFLRDLGACGVIATEYVVPQEFAADFARKFYSHFLSGEATVGEALLLTRQQFVEKNYNPLGLLYSAYVEPETRIIIDRKRR